MFSDTALLFSYYSLSLFKNHTVSKVFAASRRKKKQPTALLKQYPYKNPYSVSPLLPD
jgi:hypothetical protein